ncbi:MAG: HpcH/HpaI aldolase/citrate lyase family protein [Acidimicrobiales bacterium]
MLLAPRSALFVPASSEKMIRRSIELHADLVIVDLEDAVAQGDKEEARETLTRALNALPSPHPQPITVRVNQPGTEDYVADLHVLHQLHIDGIVVPKVESAETVQRVRRDLAVGYDQNQLLIAGIESARGVIAAHEIFAAGVNCAYFGSEDLVADLGGRRRSDSQEVLFARSKVRLDARLYGVPLIDQAFLAVHDDDGFRSDATLAIDLGYCGKICLHPSQVHLANELFSPSSEEIAHANRILAAAQGGVGLLDGEMVDAVHTKMAEQTLRRAGLLTPNKEPGNFSTLD